MNKQNRNIFMCPTCGFAVLSNSFSRECTKCGIQMEFKGKEEDEAENLRNKWKVK